MSSLSIFDDKKILFISSLVLLFVLILVFSNVTSQSALKPEEIKIDITKDILANPLLSKKEIWKVDEGAILAAEQNWKDNELLHSGSESIAAFMDNVFQVSEESNIELESVDLPRPHQRPQKLVINVKSPKERTLLQAAGKKVTVHTVQQGETMWDISRRYGIDINTIIGANLHLDNANRLKAGQELNILSRKGVIHKISPYETLSEVSNLYGVSVREIMEYNNLRSSRLSIGDTIIVPGASLPKLTKFRAGFAEDFIWPVHAPISSPFGRRWNRHHNGIDLAVDMRTPIKAARSGKVIFSGVASGYGNVVYIRHDDHTVTRYAHNNKLLVRRGEFVYRGEVITLSGNSGRSTGPHLHFEVRINNKPINPMNFLD